MATLFSFCSDVVWFGLVWGLSECVHDMGKLHSYKSNKVEEMVQPQKIYNVFLTCHFVVKKRWDRRWWCIKYVYTHRYHHHHITSLYCKTSMQPTVHYKQYSTAAACSTTENVGFYLSSFLG